MLNLRCSCSLATLCFIVGKLFFTQGMFILPDDALQGLRVYLQMFRSRCNFAGLLHSIHVLLGKSSAQQGIFAKALKVPSTQRVPGTTDCWSKENVGRFSLGFTTKQAT